MLKALIVDDEPLAHRVLEKYISGLDSLMVVDQCYDGLSAMNRIGAGGIDVVFLDIQMPDLTGLELLDALRQNSILVVLTTAFSEYAVDSFGYEQVVDYLQKPIKLGRFLQTVERLKRRHVALSEKEIEQSKSPFSNTSKGEILTLQDEHTLHRIPSEELLYIESYGNYVKAHKTDGKVIVGRKTMKDTEALLQHAGFLRTHKRYIVCISAVRAIEGASLHVGNTWLPVGKAYAEQVKSVLTS